MAELEPSGDLKANSDVLAGFQTFLIAFDVSKRLWIVSDLGLDFGNDRRRRVPLERGIGRHHYSTRSTCAQALAQAAI